MRSAGFLVLLAFLLGLWIGFNPETRARAQASFEQADAALADLGQQLSAGVDHLFNRVSEESPPPSNPPVQPERSNFLGKLQAALQQIWDALKRGWNDLMNSSSLSVRQNQP